MKKRLEKLEGKEQQVPPQNLTDSIKYLPIHKFKKAYCNPMPKQPYGNNREGTELAKLASDQKREVIKLVGEYCDKQGPEYIDGINAYPIALLLNYYGNQLNNDGLKLKKALGKKGGIL
jgi:hypothetical protein